MGQTHWGYVFKVQKFEFSTLRKKSSLVYFLNKKIFAQGNKNIPKQYRTLN